MKKFFPVVITLGAILIILLVLTYWETWDKDILDGSIWRVENIQSFPLVEYSTLTIRFHNHKVSGSSECNRFKGRYELTGNDISIEILERTDEACMEPEIIQQDGVFIDYLGKSKSYTFSGQDLKFYTATGEELLDFLLIAE
jgi:heat shock protein HslJ